MKALSLKQPWAELILQGKKTIELRKWNTNFRGDFLIHSSKIPDKKGMREFGFKDSDLPCGFILGKARLAEVKRYHSDKEFLADRNKHLATKSWGTYGFILEDIRRTGKIPAKGRLNFWNFEKRIRRIQ